MLFIAYFYRRGKGHNAKVEGDLFIWRWLHSVRYLQNLLARGQAAERDGWVTSSVEKRAKDNGGTSLQPYVLAKDDYRIWS